MQDWIDTHFPQIPQDWANHISYSFGAAIPLTVLLYLHFAHACLIVLLASWLICGAKKWYDYLTEKESIAVCVGKTFVTGLAPLSWTLLQYLVFVK